MLKYSLSENLLTDRPDMPLRRTVSIHTTSQNLLPVCWAKVPSLLKQM